MAASVGEGDGQGSGGCFEIVGSQLPPKLSPKLLAARLISVRMSSNPLGATRQPTRTSDKAIRQADSMDLWTARLRANRAVLPWITTILLSTAPPSDHKFTDPQNQELFDMGFKGDIRSLTFELIEANTLCSWFRPFCGEKVNPSSQIQAVSMPTVQQADE